MRNQPHQRATCRSKFGHEVWCRFVFSVWQRTSCAPKLRSDSEHGQWLRRLDFGTGWMCIGRTRGRLLLCFRGYDNLHTKLGRKQLEEPCSLHPLDVLLASSPHSAPSQAFVAHSLKCLSVCLSVCLSLSLRMCICMYIYMYTRIRARTHTYAHIHTTTACNAVSMSQGWRVHAHSNALHVGDSKLLQDVYAMLDLDMPLPEAALRSDGRLQPREDMEKTESGSQQESPQHDGTLTTEGKSSVLTTTGAQLVHHRHSGISTYLGIGPEHRTRIGHAPRDPVVF